jgi:hypothetical protein
MEATLRLITWAGVLAAAAVVSGLVIAVLFGSA